MCPSPRVGWKKTTDRLTACASPPAWGDSPIRGPAGVLGAAQGEGSTLVGAAAEAAGARALARRPASLPEPRRPGRGLALLPVLAALGGQQVERSRVRRAPRRAAAGALPARPPARARAGRLAA